MRPPHCHGRPEIYISLTLNIGKDGPVIFGEEGRGNNSFQTMLGIQKSKAIVENSLHPLAIILLPNASPRIAMGGLKLISDSPWMLDRMAL
jgi:hypothetical protein